MFRVVFHPPSGAHSTVSTVSDINETCTATCRERGWMGTAVSVQPRSRKLAGSRTGLIKCQTL